VTQRAPDRGRRRRRPLRQRRPQTPRSERRSLAPRCTPASTSPARRACRVVRPSLVLSGQGRGRSPEDERPCAAARRARYRPTSPRRTLQQRFLIATVGPRRPRHHQPVLRADLARRSEAADSGRPDHVMLVDIGEDRAGRRGRSRRLWAGPSDGLAAVRDGLPPVAELPASGSSRAGHAGPSCAGRDSVLRPRRRPPAWLGHDVSRTWPQTSTATIRCRRKRSARLRDAWPGRRRLARSPTSRSAAARRGCGAAAGQRRATAFRVR